MADQQPRKLWRIVLVTSLALNLAVVGVIGGLALRSSGDKGPPRNFDVGLGSIGRALSQEDRRAIGSALRNAPGSRASGRAENEAMLDSLRHHNGVASRTLRRIKSCICVSTRIKSFCIDMTEAAKSTHCHAHRNCNL